MDRATVLAEQQEKALASQVQQASPHSAPLPELQGASPKQVAAALERIQDHGIHDEAIKIAAGQGALRVDPATGEPVFCGRREDGALMQLQPMQTNRKAKPDVRGRFPPILRGDSDETLVVQDGMAALQKMSDYLDAGEPLPNFIITGGKPFALSGDQAKELLDASRSANREEKRDARNEQESGKSRDKDTQAAAEMEAASRRA